MIITESTVLKAVWKALHTITFNANGGGGTMAPVYVGSYEHLPEPECKFTPPVGELTDNWVFDGWYTNSALTIAFDPTKTITSDMTLYAKWICYIGEVRKQVPLPNIGEAPAQPYDLVIEENGETFIDHCTARASWSPNDETIKSGTSYTVTVIVSAYGNGTYRFSDDTKFYINNNLVSYEILNPTTASMIYEFEPVYYEKLPF